VKTGTKIWTFYFFIAGLRKIHDWWGILYIQAHFDQYEQKKLLPFSHGAMEGVHLEDVTIDAYKERV